MQAPLPSVEQIAEACFQQLEAEVNACAAADIPDHQLLRLQHLFGKHWLNALRVVEESGVTCYVAHPSGRKAFKVKGKSGGEWYTVFPQHFCTCQSFFYEVVNKKDALCCKHQLAARLAAMLQRCRTVELSDLAMAQLLMQSLT